MERVVVARRDPDRLALEGDGMDDRVCGDEGLG
jgi:hypothetical protein